MEREGVGERERTNTAAILADGGEQREGRGKDEGRMGDHGASIDPQNTLPHVESIRNNLVFYPLLQKNGGFSVDV